MKKLIALMTAAAAVVVLVACSSDTERHPLAASPNPTATPSSASDNEASPSDSDTEEPSSTTPHHDHRRGPDVRGDTQRHGGRPGLREDAAEHVALIQELKNRIHHRVRRPTDRDRALLYGCPPGDIVYYNPLDIIYEETSSVPTLTKMGEVTSDPSAFRDLPDNIDMRIEETTS